MKKGIKQHDIRDCGAACLATICLFYKSKIPLVYLRQLLKVDKNGASLYALSKAAEQLNFKAEGLYGNWEELNKAIIIGEIHLPSIAHIITKEGFTHYIVLKRIKNNKIYVFDPAKGNNIYLSDEFISLWTGYVLSIIPSDEYEPVNMKKGAYKKYLNIIAKQKNGFVWTIILSALLSILSIISSVLYQKWIDVYVLENSGTISSIKVLTNLSDEICRIIGNLDRMVILLIGLVIIETTIIFTRGFILALITKKSCETLMSEFYEHSLELPLSFFKDRETGEILSRFQDIGEMQSLLAGIGLSAVLDTILAFVGGYILYSVNSILFAITVTIAILYSIIVFVYKKPISETNREAMENEAKVTSVLKEAFDGIETIKSVQGEDNYYNKLIKKTTIFMRTIFRINFIEISQSGLLYLLSGIGYLMVLWIGSKMVINGILSLGTLIAFESLMGFFLTPIENLVGLQTDFQQAVVVAERLNDVFDVDVERPGESEIEQLADDKNDIKLSNVSFSYGYRVPVINKLSLEIKTGEKVALVGESGCGKTTLARLMAGLYEPTSGSIMLDGIMINNIPLYELRKRVGYINQDSTLFSGTIEENLLFGKKVLNKEYLNEIIRRCHIKEIIDMSPSGIKANIGENGKTLSGGQRQRISLGRTLLCNPRVLIMDEATSNLDEKTERDLIDYVLEEPKRTCIIISHKKTVIEKCERVIFIKNGTVWAEGSPESLVINCSDYREYINHENTNYKH